MRGIADSLTDQDINDIAAYYEKPGQRAQAAAPTSPDANAERRRSPRC